MSTTRTLTQPAHILPGELRELDRGSWYKPLDVGEAGLSASVNPAGRLLVITEGHPTHGQLQLTPAPELAADQRYSQQAVRAFRSRLSAPDAPSFGITSSAGSPHGIGSGTWLWHEALPVTVLGDPEDDPRSGMVTLVPHPHDVDGGRGIVQVRLSGAPDLRGSRWNGRLRLARAPYPQLTEGGPLPPPASRPSLERHADALVMHDAALGWAAAIAGDLALTDGDAVAVLEDGWFMLDLPLHASWTRVSVGLGRDVREALDSAAALLARSRDALLSAAGRRWSRRWESWPARNHPLERIARRGLAYALSCCVVPVDNGVCLITDHRLLPLAWTRDGYFVARAFLDWSAKSSIAEPAEIVRRHLVWLFKIADRPEGWWARSHLVGGQRKDGAFQIDQQLYPLLELVDYTRSTSDGAPLAAYAGLVPAILAALDARSDPVSGLFATEETAADEPATLPYQTASQIMAWRVLTQLASLGIGGSALAQRAERLRRSVFRELVTTAPDGARVFAHAGDGRGACHFYHDANDIPLALAAEWGFCSSADEIWSATMTSVLTPTHAGFSAGNYAGLGSIHTPGPWPLGQLQPLIASSQLGARMPVEGSHRALRAEAQWDGLLPEASDPTSGRPTSRPWFAWPGAVAASCYLTHEEG